MLRTAGSLVALLALRAFAEESLASRGYDHFYNLDYDPAIAEFTAETQEHPDDANAWNHLAHAILYRAMYRSGALESELVTGSNPFLHREKVRISPADDRLFDSAIAKSMQLSQTRTRANPNDAQALYTLGVAYGLRANYNFLVRKAWLDSLHDATEARNAHRRVCELQPDNVDARLIPGVYDYVVGSLPLGYRILGFLAGHRGDRMRGIRMLQSVASSNGANHVDAKLVLAAIYRRERRPADAIPLLSDLAHRFPRNYLLRFEIVQMYSDQGDKQNALAEIEQIWKLQRAGAPGYRNLAPEKIDYLEGNLLFWYNDLDDALEHLQKVAAKSNDLDINTGLMSWMRLGQIYDLQGRHQQAVDAYKKAAAIAPQSEIGKESREYITTPYRRRKAQSSSFPRLAVQLAEVLHCPIT